MSESEPVSEQNPERTTQCAICGTERPSEVVDHTTIDPLSPEVQITACKPCQITYNDQAEDKHCIMCNGEPPAHYIEVGTPIGDSSHHGVLSGVLCEECAGEIARIINNANVDNATNGAREQMMDNLRT